VDIADNFQLYTTIAFIIGAYTSVISGFLGMRIAVYANVRTAFAAQ
jgi:H+-translocating diphosphatase